ncbi:MAG: cation transporter [Oscillospiraceae bacterium]|nr:cation transporter [Oscillospiraceae bacterium]
MKEAVRRDQQIIRTSVVGIVANVFLAAFKAVIGLLSHSIAVTLDAVNNLSDALSSVITIIGTRLANRAPDKKHPLGHGRVEYLSAMIVAAIVLYAGITSLVESVKKILQPETPDYSVISLVIIAAAIAVKLLLGQYVKSQGKKNNSGALVASGEDARFDAILSASVLASALIFKLTGLSLEAWVGVVIAVFIIRSGIEMMTETLDDILGHRADAELTQKIRHLLTEEPEVRGAYDLFLDNYGPDRNYASVHLELPDVMTVDEVDRLTRRVQAKVFQETGVILTGVGVYSYNTKDDEAAVLRTKVLETVLAHDWALQLHGFHADLEKKELRFDVVTDFDVDPKEAMRTLYQEVEACCPGYQVCITRDVDLAD